MHFDEQLNRLNELLLGSKFRMGATLDALDDCQINWLFDQ